MTRLRRQNLRLGAKDIEIRRMASLALARQGVEPRQRASAVDGLDLTGAVQEDWPFAGWTREQALAFDDHMAESNARFARDYGIDDDGVLFRDELPRDFDDRGRPASWEGLSVAERKAARDRVIRELNVDIENGSGGGGRVILAGSAPRRTSVGLARRWALEIWKRGRQLAGHARVWRGAFRRCICRPGLRRSVHWVRSRARLQRTSMPWAAAVWRSSSEYGMACTLSWKRSSL